MSPSELDGAILYHADCWDVLPPLEAVDHIITDMPYEITTHVNRIRKTVDSAEPMEKKAFAFEALSDDLRAFVCAEAKRLCRGWGIFFCLTEETAAWRDAIVAAGGRYKTHLLWNKVNSSPQFNGQHPAVSWEEAVCGWFGKGHSRWNSGGKRGYCEHRVNGTRATKHPTEKPLSLMKELVADFTQPGDLVLDPCMGSGTTGVACVELGRRFIGIEMNPEYFQWAQQRIGSATSQQDLFIEKPVQQKLFGAGGT